MTRDIGLALFDLDCTLYPSSTGLLERVDANITHFIRDLLDIPYDQADQLRVAYRETYGTTLRGLQVNHGVKPNRFFAAIFNLDLSQYLRPDPALANLLRRIKVRSAIFTNGTASYARRVLDHLGLAGLFDAIYDIQFCGYLGKPFPQAYQRVLAAEKLPAQACLMIEDSPANLTTALDLGMLTVLVSHDEAPLTAFHHVIPSVHALDTVLPGLFVSQASSAKPAHRR